MVAAVPSTLISCFILLSCSLFASLGSASEFFLVVSNSTTLQLSPSLLVEKSPGSKPGTTVKCERVSIHGLPRIKHLSKFANSLKVEVSCVNKSGCPPYIQICFHRNSSLGIGMCPHDQWERLSKGLCVKSMSPFDHKILDIRMVASYSEVLQISLHEEFYMYRILFLVMGIVLMSLASCLSKSLAFYYSSAMLVGVLLVVLIILFQGMKLLPTGRKSSFAIFLYSFFVGLGSFLLRYVPRLLQSLLVEIGLSEDMYNPVAIFLLVFLAIFGAWLGFWAVRKLVLSTDGSIDTGVSHFVTWSIRIVGSVMILQSSTDPLLAAEAFVGGIIISLVLSKFGHSKIACRIYRKMSRLNKTNFRESHSPYTSPATKSTFSRPSNRSPYTPIQSASSKSPKRLSNSETFYSTFHSTPNRKKITKDEWDSFTKETTRSALEDLIASPDFNKWAVSHADRITLAPKNGPADKSGRWFHWF
ncbi:uncharacterized protein LOC127248532 [Andrographis paniculata]|uniref:uncharacterized protein LOC127248532 n=1 Tax=Andrographis paniculata TaxID=175694 RepID=UPI0021E74837|nr:uncharacterized protein LOC127248532 [Andrographis paniculata]